MAYTIGTAMLVRDLKTHGSVFNGAKRWVYVATALAVLIWFLGFTVIGGEWFTMWQSTIWNGQQTDFRIYMTALGAGIFVVLADIDISR